LYISGALGFQSERLLAILFFMGWCGIFLVRLVAKAAKIKTILAYSSTSHMGYA
jgi:NADH:ubiquinone oxidoreductase subunit 4 (subunit M)